MDIETKRKKISLDWQWFRHERKWIPGDHPFWYLMKLVDIFLARDEGGVQAAEELLNGLKKLEVKLPTCPMCAGNDISIEETWWGDGVTGDHVLIPCRCLQCDHCWDDRYDVPEFAQYAFLAEGDDLANQAWDSFIDPSEEPDDEEE